MEEQPWLLPQVYFCTSNNKPHEDNATSSLEYEKFFVLYSWNKITDGSLDIHSIPVSFFLKKKKKITKCTCVIWDFPFCLQVANAAEKRMFASSLHVTNTFR